MHMLAQNVSSLALMHVYGRVARILLQQAEQKDGEMVTGRITQQEIADMVGASRAMVSRILKDLKEGVYLNRKEAHYDSPETPRSMVISYILFSLARL